MLMLPVWPAEQYAAVTGELPAQRAINTEIFLLDDVTVMITNAGRMEKLGTVSFD